MEKMVEVRGNFLEAAKKNNTTHTTQNRKQTKREEKMKNKNTDEWIQESDKMCKRNNKYVLEKQQDFV